MLERSEVFWKWGDFFLMKDFNIYLQYKFSKFLMSTSNFNFRNTGLLQILIFIPTTYSALHK